MKFSPLALRLFASTTLVSVSSAAVTGGVRGSIDQVQTHRSLQGHRAPPNSSEPDCTDCRGGCLMKPKTGRNKCQTIELPWRKDALQVTETECGVLQSFGYAEGWCAYAVFGDAADEGPLRWFDSDSP